MKRVKLKTAGFCFIFFGLLFMLNSNPLLTGSTIIGEIEKSHPFIGFISLILGFFLFIFSKYKPHSLESLLSSGKFKKNLGGKDLKRLITKAGYELRSGGKHYKVYSSEGKIVLGKTRRPVTIPYHKEISKYESKEILEDIIDYEKKK